MTNNPVGWFEIYVQDMTRARAFYEAMLGVPLTKLDATEFDMWAFPMDPVGHGARGALIRLPGVASGGGGTLVYFRCTDCGVVAERAVKAGGRIETPKKSIGGYGYIALVIDSEGNLVGLHSMQ